MCAGRSGDISDSVCARGRVVDNKGTKKKKKRNGVFVDNDDEVSRIRGKMSGSSFGSDKLTRRASVGRGQRR